jgi:hypothetical protein
VLYRLVVHRTPGGLVRVFLPRPPSAGGPPGEPVHLGELSPSAGRRLLGRHTADRRSYREFRSEAELRRAGYEPAGPYRVCGTWDEFLNPWATCEMNEQPTERMEA